MGIPGGVRRGASGQATRASRRPTTGKSCSRPSVRSWGGEDGGALRDAHKRGGRPQGNRGKIDLSGDPPPPAFNWGHRRRLSAGDAAGPAPMMEDRLELSPVRQVLIEKAASKGLRKGDRYEVMAGANDTPDKPLQNGRTSTWAPSTTGTFHRRGPQTSRNKEYTPLGTAPCVLSA